VLYCPKCSTKLKQQNISGRIRPTCPLCKYTSWGSNTLGVGGVLVDGNKVLLVQRAQDPGRGRWCIPGGYVEVDEKLEGAVHREILEETGLSTEAVSLLGIRDYPADTPERDHDVYFVFLMRLLGGILKLDHHEVSQAGFLTLEECLKLDIPPVSLYFIQSVLQNPQEDRGFLREDQIQLVGLKSELYSRTRV